jgi:hypothetical protein
MIIQQKIISRASSCILSGWAAHGRPGCHKLDLRCIWFSIVNAIQTFTPGKLNEVIIWSFVASKRFLPFVRTTGSSSVTRRCGFRGSLSSTIVSILRENRLAGRAAFARCKGMAICCVARLLIEGCTHRSSGHTSIAQWDDLNQQRSLEGAKCATFLEPQRSRSGLLRFFH